VARRGCIKYYIRIHAVRRELVPHSGGGDEAIVAHQMPSKRTANDKLLIKFSPPGRRAFSPLPPLLTTTTKLRCCVI